jgi:hypothetical protein
MFVPARHAQGHLDCAPCVVVILLQESNFYPTQDDRITSDFVLFMHVFVENRCFCFVIEEYTNCY